MNYQHIAYVSLAVAPPSQEQIDALLLSARSFNKEHGITGVLLCHKNTFFQFIEGSPESINLVYQRIKSASLHHNLLELSNISSDKRYFENWSMGFCFIPKSEMQELAQAEWMTKVNSVNQNAQDSNGIKMLKEYWNRLSVKDTN